MALVLQAALQYSCAGVVDSEKQKCPLAMECVTSKEQYRITESNCMLIMYRTSYEKSAVR